MIDRDYISLMARYNRWQNEAIYSAAGSLTDAARREDRGAFFHSIHGTLGHILWADQMWMHRFVGTAAPAGGIAESTAEDTAFEMLTVARMAMDEMIENWASGIAAEDIAQDLTWYSGAAQREFTKPKALLITHMFNHQTHHRGQVHAMLTAAGVKTTDTDLPFMP